MKEDTTKPAADAGPVQHGVGRPGPKRVSPFRRWHLGYGTCSWRGYRTAGWGLSLRVTNFFGPWMVIRLGRRCWTFRGEEK